MTLNRKGSKCMGKPNVVIIYADDLGYGDVGCFGSTEISTPNIDRLADQGIKFTNWYSNAPVCSPSRASLLTGLYPQKAEVSQILRSHRGTEGMPVTYLTIAELLKAEEYETGIFGKWHLGSSDETKPIARGFDKFFGFLGGCVDYYSHIYYWGDDGTNPVHDLWEDDKEVWHNGEYMTDLVAKKACEFIESAHERPFFAYVPFNAPHYPMHAPQKYIDLYKDLPSSKRIMAAMITAMDEGIGKIINILEEQGKLDETIIFFSSDNGPSTESRNFLDGSEDLYYGGSAGLFRGHKASLFEGGIREPAILSYPDKLPKGIVSDEMFIMMDVLPTILDLIGAAIPKNVELDGKSILRSIFDNETTHEQLFWAFNEQAAVRKGNWKLVLNGKLDFTRKQADNVHLSDLANDLGERNNVAQEHPEIVEELMEAIERWQETLVK